MFSAKVADSVLIKCGRHCAICGKYCAQKIELHHIVPKVCGGGDTEDNCIPLCFDCHAEVASYNIAHPRGRKYSHTELTQLKANCYKFNALQLKEGEPFEHLCYTYNYKILNQNGSKASISNTSRLLVMKNQIIKGGSGWTCLPEKLKVSLQYHSEEGRLIKDKYNVFHSEPEQRGNNYWWDNYYDPPLVKGQVVTIADEFEVNNQFNSDICKDAIFATRGIREFKWQISFPKIRMAKRWWVTADYIPGKPDNYLLYEYNRKASKILWHHYSLRQGAIYYINWEW